MKTYLMKPPNFFHSVPSPPLTGSNKTDIRGWSNDIHGWSNDIRGWSNDIRGWSL